MTYFLNLSIINQLSILYIIAINIIAFFYIGFDKLQSQLQKKRVQEKLLWFIVILGGTFGTIAGMHFFRHKTKKISFQLVVASICIIQMLMFYALFFL